jgi:tetratricopeptide (TPR) repeat protein
LKRLPDYQKTASIGNYDLYQLKGPNHYVEPLAYEPVLWIGGDWKTASYTWFRHHEFNDVHLIFPVGLQEREFDRFPLKISDLSSIPRRPLPAAPPVKWEKISDGEIAFETEALHRAHLVKFSFHPNWRVEGADRIYLVSPAFMLVFPNQPRVRLYYARSFPDYLGLAMTLIGLIGVLAFWKRRAGGPWPLPLWTGSTVVWMCGLGSLGIVLSFLGVSGYQARRDMGPTLLANGVRYRDQGKWDLAEKSFQRLIEKSPMSGPAEQAQYHLGILRYLRQQWDGSIQEFRKLQERYPESRLRAEANFHMALCYENLGLTPERDRLIRIILQDYPNTPWAMYARQRWPRVWGRSSITQ